MKKVAVIIASCSSLVATTLVLKQDANIRVEPSVLSKKIDVYYKGDSVNVLEVIETKKHGTWIKTDKGYVWGNLTTLEESIKNIGDDGIKHPFNNPLYVDASQLENKPAIVQDESEHISTKNVIETTPVEPQSQITQSEVVSSVTLTQPPIVEPTVVVPEVILSPIVVADIKQETIITQPIDTNTSIIVVDEKPQVVINDINTTETQIVAPVVVEIPVETNTTTIVVQEEQIQVIPVKVKEMSIPQKKPKNFIGLALNLNSFSVDKTNQVGNIVLNKPLDEKATSFLFQVGTTLSQNYILSGNYEVVNLNDVNIDSYFLSLDYRFEYEKLSPYLGISLGMSDLKWQYDPLVNSQLKDTKLSSLLHGVQGGFVYPLEHNWSLFSQLAYQKLNFKTNLTSTPAKSTITHDDKKSLGIGFRYSF